MGFLSFTGRVLLACFFINSAVIVIKEIRQDACEVYQDGNCPPVKELKSKLWGIHEEIVMAILAISMVLRIYGGLLLIFNTTIGAYFLIIHLLVMTPLQYDFYRYDRDAPEFSILLTKFVQSLSCFGALLFFLGMKWNLMENKVYQAKYRRKAPKQRTI